MKKSVQIAVGIGVITSVLLTGCGKKETVEQHHAMNGDLREKTSSLEQLPTFLDAYSPTVQEAYRTASTVTDLLPYMPCYCGCGESAGHLSNLNCFVSEISEDGTVTWDDHGTRCGVCMEIAVTTALMKEEGRSIAEIRALIDQQYGKGYGVPTPTPMPA